MSMLGFSKCMAHLEWSKQNNKGSGYQVQWLSAEESRDNKTDSRVQTCSTNLLLEVTCMVKVLAGLQTPAHKKRGFYSLSSRPFQHWMILNSGRGQHLHWCWRLKDHLVGMPRVRSRCLLGCLSDLGLHVQYTPIGCITDKGNTRANPKYWVALLSLTGQCLGRYTPTQLLCFTSSLKSTLPGMLIPVWAYS